MIDFCVRSVIDLQGLDLTLPSGDRKCVIDCDRENKLYHFPYQFSIVFLFRKVLRRLGLSLLTQNADMPSSAVSMDKYRFKAIRKCRVYYKASRARGFPPTHKGAREYPQPLRRSRNFTCNASEISQQRLLCYITLPKAIYHISLCEIYYYERSVINAHKKHCNTHKSYRKRTRSH